MGHMKQLDRFGPELHTDTVMRRGDGTEQRLDGTGNSGELSMPQNTVVEYHNRLDEFLRLTERGIDEELLAQHFDELDKWRIKAEKSGFGRGGRLTAWARDHFPEIPALEERVRTAGRPLHAKSSRW
jgi:hypothetical protein